MTTPIQWYLQSPLQQLGPTLWMPLFICYVNNVLTRRLVREDYPKIAAHVPSTYAFLCCGTTKDMIRIAPAVIPAAPVPEILRPRIK